jgi:glycerophosphoryl diester phosphodiesterase
MIMRRLGGLIAFVVTIMLVTAQAAAGLTIFGHRGADILGKIPENTKMAFEYAQHADVWETDVRWTRDPTPGDPVMVLSHDSTTDRVFNCSYPISSTYWPTLRDKCRTRIASQPMMTLRQLVDLANAKGKGLNVEIKTGDISDWKAGQFYREMIRANGPVIVSAFDGAPLRSLLKVKALDAKDGSHKLRYGYTTSTLPTLAKVKSVGWNLMVKHTAISKAQVKYFRDNGVSVNLWIGYTEADYEAMTAKAPSLDDSRFGLIVNDPEAYWRWLNG